jgi:serine/threonine-protein kinase
MRITLTVTEGPHSGQVYSFEGHDTFLVGRSKRAHFRLPSKDRYFSRIHFLIEVNPPQCRLTDMGSRNGTHVNGTRVERAALKDGDEIRAGKTVLRVAVGSTPTVLSEPPVATHEPRLPAAAVGPAPLSGGSTAALSVRVRTPPPLPALPVPAPESPPTLPSLPAPPPPPAFCRACRAVLPVGLPSAGPVWLCSACEEQARAQAQAIPGYLLVRRIGHGAMGVVSLAVGKADGRPVAVKTITPAVAGSPAQVQRFLREADILRQLDHPNIVTFRDLGETEGLLYFAMDYVHGKDLCRLLKREGSMQPRRAVPLACQLLEGLAYAHERGFIHRDIKPSNVLLTTEGTREVVKLVDFGLAKVYQASQLSGLTLSGDIGGTMAFMPPEQITEYREARPPADQYAAAATLYNLLTNAFIHDLPAEFHNQVLVVLHDDPTPLRDRRPEVPAALADVIHRALAREPDERFPNVIEFRKALLPFAE